MGFERAGDGRALVMELVEGRTLADLTKGAMPLDEAFAIARQIADALEAGQRFLALVPAPARGDAGFTVLTNWQTTLNVR